MAEDHPAKRVHSLSRASSASVSVPASGNGPTNGAPAPRSPSRTLEAVVFSIDIVVHSVLQFLSTADGARLRAVSPRLRAAVREHAWADTSTPVARYLDAWAVCFPRAAAIHAQFCGCGGDGSEHPSRSAHVSALKLAAALRTMPHLR